jgi:NAD(P)H-flavin reductase/cytochrome b involved in lipid metabolism
MGYDWDCVNSVVPHPENAALRSHGVLMIGVALVIQPLSIYISRYCRHYPWWITLHPLLASMGLGGVIIMGLTAIAATNKYHITHDYVGTAIVALYACHLAAGYFSRMIRDSDEPASSRMLWFRWIHRKLGWVIMILGWVNVRLGIDHIWDPYQSTVAIKYYDARTAGRIIHFVCVFLWSAIFFVSEIDRQFRSFAMHLKSFGDNASSILSQLSLLERVLVFVELLLLDTTALITRRFGKFSRNSTRKMEVDSTDEAGEMKNGGQHASNLETKLPIITWDEVHERIASGSMWIVVSGYVVDARNLVSFHPGGRAVIAMAIGTDVTRQFFGVNVLAGGYSPHAHSAGAFQTLKSLVVGRVVELEVSKSGTMNGLQAEETDEYEYESQAFDEEKQLSLPHGLKESRRGSAEFQKSVSGRYAFMKLKQRTLLNLGARNPVYRFIFEIPPDALLWQLTPGLVFKFMMILSGSSTVVERSYTPVEFDPASRKVSFLVKIYKTGTMTQHLFKMELGTKLKFRIGNSQTRLFNSHSQSGHFDSFAVICSGSGLSVALQLIEHHMPEKCVDPCKMRVFFFNHSPAEIFYKSRLEALSVESEGRLEKIMYSVSDIGLAHNSEKLAWDGKMGFDESVLHSFFEVESDKLALIQVNKIFVCGRRQFTQSVSENLFLMGYSSKQVIQLE